MAKAKLAKAKTKPQISKFVQSKPATKPKASHPNIFANVVRHDLPAKKKKGKDVLTRKMPGLELFGDLTAIEKSVEAERAKVRSILEGMTFDFQARDGFKIKAPPANFEGVDGNTTGNMQLKRRASNSWLTGMEVVACKQLDLPLEKVTKGNVVETFILNPEFAGEEDFLQEVSDALQEAYRQKKLSHNPKNIFQQQAPPVGYIVTEETIAEAYKLTSLVDLKIAQRIVQRFACRPTNTEPWPKVAKRGALALAKSPDPRKAKKKGKDEVQDDEED